VSARLALGASAMMGAAFVVLQSTRADTMPDWAASLIGACVFALAIAVNFAPGVAASSNFEEHFHRRGRGQKRG
jgi:hypothetical protein